MPLYVGKKKINTVVKFETLGDGGSKYGATGGTFLGDVDENGVLQKPSKETHLVFDGVKEIAGGKAIVNGTLDLRQYQNIKSVTFSDLTTICTSGLEGALNNMKGLTSVSFPKLVTATNDNAFSSICVSCSNLTEINFPKLQEAGSYCFHYAFEYTALSNASFPELTSIGYMGFYFAFRGCSLSNASFPELTTIEQSGMAYAFHSVYGLKSITFPKLSSVGAAAFERCFFYGGIQNIYFPALNSTSFGTYNNAFSMMLQGVTGCTVHFPSNLESILTTWSDVTNGFNGTNTTVLFDLPETY